MSKTTNTLIDKEAFLKKYNINEEIFNKTQLDWSLLTDIYCSYANYKEELEPAAIHIFNRLMKAPLINSVRYRLKDPEHLVEKIIRKKIESPTLNVTPDNYAEEITDLIGVRAIHLFKEDWEGINDFINSNWHLKGNPTANYREGDSEQIINFYKEKGCNVKMHKFGYRSVHYLIETKPGKKIFYAEIQVRTIFEEGWSEIDHKIRYPYNVDNQLFFQFLLILNRLAGSADEMGSYIKYLQETLDEKQSTFNDRIKEKDELIAELRTTITNLRVQDKTKSKLQEKLILLQENINVNPFANITNFAFPPSQLFSITEKFNEQLKLIQNINPRFLSTTLKGLQENKVSSPKMPSGEENETSNTKKATVRKPNKKK
jgi:putative GTP pyrophosphokinase